MKAGSLLSQLKIKGFAFLAFIFIVFSTTIYSQNVAVTDNESYSANASAMLDVYSTTKGMLIPRLTTMAKDTMHTPEIGLIVFDTGHNSFFYYTSSGWVKIPQVNSSGATGSALFAVVNAAGDTIFAVYNDGVKVTVPPGSKGSVGGFAVSGRTQTKGIVETEYFRVTPDSTRIYINDTSAHKGSVGGFAVSGRTQTKAGEFDYLRVTPDSTRVYVNEDSTKGSVGGFAVSGRTLTKAGTKNYFLSTFDSTRIFVPEGLGKGSVGGFAVSGRTLTKGTVSDYFNISGNTQADVVYNEPRIMWYPIKSAFMAGEVHVGSSDSVGTNSTALGHRSIAMGNFSQAMGYKAKSLGLNSTAIGNNAIAYTTNSFAFGDGTKAKNTDSYAFGKNAVANGLSSYAFGDSSTTALAASNSFAFGQLAKAIGINSFAFGYLSKAEGNSSFALGGYAKGSSSYAFGGTAEGDNSRALGGTARGLQSLSVGNQVNANGDYSIAMGVGVNATGERAVAMGSPFVYFNPVTFQTLIYPTEASGESSVAIGVGVKAVGVSSVSFGRLSYANSMYCTAIGVKNVGNGSATTWVSTDPLFEIGNGGTYVSSNAFTVLKNGNTGINTATPYAALHIKSNAGLLNLEGTDHCFIQFYPDSYAAGRKGYFGYPGASSNDISLSNEISSGDIILNPGTSGFVGVKTADPNYNIESYGVNASLIAHYSGQSRGGIAAISGGRVALLTTYSGDNIVFGYTTTVDQASFSSNFIERMKIDNATGDIILTNVYNRSVGATNRDLYIDNTGKVGYVSSSARYKENIEGMENIDWLYDLRPVNFTYKNDIAKQKEYGLIAEEVELINKILVSYNKDGTVETVNYSKLVIPLLKAIQDQNQEIEYLKSELEKIRSVLNSNSK